MQRCVRKCSDLRLLFELETLKTEVETTMRRVEDYRTAVGRFGRGIAQDLGSIERRLHSENLDEVEAAIRHIGELRERVEGDMQVLAPANKSYARDRH